MVTIKKTSNVSNPAFQLPLFPNLRCFSEPLAHNNGLYQWINKTNGLYCTSLNRLNFPHQFSLLHSAHPLTSLTNGLYCTSLNFPHQWSLLSSYCSYSIHPCTRKQNRNYGLPTWHKPILS